MTVSIKDIAKKANVTPTAVSMALRGRAGVSSQKREEIKNLAQKMGYRPSFLGRALQGGKTHSIGILWSLCGPHPSMNVTRDLTLRAMRREYISYVVDSLSDPVIIDQTLEDFVRRRVDALIILHDRPGEVIDRLKAFPAGVVVSHYPYQVDADYIYYDLTAGIRQMARYFLSKGRRRPMVLCGAPVDWQVVNQFLSNDRSGPMVFNSWSTNMVKTYAFLSEFQTQGIEVRPESVVDVLSNDPQDVSKILDRWQINAATMPDVVFASTDHLAAAALKWFKSHKIKVPETVAVGGFNDESLCDYFDPPLASVHRNDKALAVEIDRLIFSRLEDPDLPPRNVEVPMSFVWRESAG